MRLFDVADDEHVVSAARVDEDETPENEAEALVAEETGAAPVDGLVVDDGTGPQTMDERVEEEDDE